MRFYKVFFIVLAAVSVLACAPEPKPSTPLNTLDAYANAYKRKDITGMKLLLSDDSLKMAEQAARAENTTVDEIVKRETLFSETQTTAVFRNQKIEGDHATIDVKNSFDSWDTVAFVLEQGVWKIDKQAMANKMLEEMEQKNKQLDEMKNKELDDIINQGRIP